ncbi:MAG: outer membrane beta-barrel protein [Elusimicrobiota bacterium]
MVKVLLKSIVMLAILFGLNEVSFGKSPGTPDKILSIGPRITFTQPKDADSGALYGGAQVRLSLTQILKLEGSIDYRSNDFALFTKVNVVPIQASVMTYINTGTSISPYLLAGAGLYYTQVEGPFNLSYTTNRFGVHIGAGLEVLLTDTLSLDSSFRSLWVEKFSSKDAAAIDKEYEDSGYMITLALNLLF